MQSGPPEGLHHEPQWLDADEQDRLLAAIDAMEWSNVLRRRVQHYGWRYDYRARRVSADDRIGPLPAPLEALTVRLRSASWFPEPPDQAIVNEYEPGQGIAPHIDCRPCFGDVIASVSLGGACVMRFQRRGEAADHDVVLWPGTLLVMRGPARHEWRHGIAPRRSDLIDGRRMARGRRVSVTFRTVLRAS